MHQRYKSTRGGTAQDDYSFEEALFSGYAPDGGLFVPASLPSCREKEQYLRWSNIMTFPELAYDVLVSMLAHESFALLLDKLFQTILRLYCIAQQRNFISPTEIDDANLKSICDKSFPADAFDEECYIPIKEVGSSLHIAELFHGPTFCFKDFG